MLKMKQTKFRLTHQSVASLYLLILSILYVSVPIASGQDPGVPDPDPEMVNRTTLYIGAFFPFGSSWDGSGIIPAVEMALDDINSRPDILPGYELKMVWNDTQCEAGLGTGVLFDQIYSKPQKLLLLGGGCSTATQAIAGTAYHWNIVTLSYGAASPELSNRKMYPYFYRTYTPDTMYNQARVRLMQDYGWNRVATIHENHELFSLAIDDLHNILEVENITVISQKSFTEDPRKQVVDLKNQDAKIIAANMYETKARQVFCEAYHQGMTAKNGYVWLLLGWYSDKWWEVEDVRCSKEEMREAVFGYIAIESVTLGDSDIVTVANITSAAYELQLRERLNWPQYRSYDWNPISPYGYDAIWAIALMLNRTVNDLKTKRFADNSTRRLEDFNYDDEEMAAMFFHNLNETNFIGVTGPVSFAHGDRPGINQIEQLQVICDENWYLSEDYCYKVMTESVSWTEASILCQEQDAKLANLDNMVDVEVIDSNNRTTDLINRVLNNTEISQTWVAKLSNMSCTTDVTNDNCPALNLDMDRCNHVPCTSEMPFLCQKKGDLQELRLGLYNPLDGDLKMNVSIKWPGNRVPLDQTPPTLYTVTSKGIPTPVFITFTIIACLGISLALVFLCFNMKYRNQRSVRLSSPYLNNLIIFDSIILYIWIILFGLSIDLINDQSLLAVCQIRHWFLSIGFILGFGAMFSKTWRVYRVATFKKPKRVIVSDTHLFLTVLGFLYFDILLLIIWQATDPMSVEPPTKTDSDIANQIIYHYCHSDHHGFWLAGVAGYKGLLLLFGAFLAWETRQVNIDELNDSKLIGMSVYTVVILSGVGLAVSVTVTSNPGLSYMFLSCIVFFCTSMTLIIIFVPKMVGVKKYPDGRPVTSFRTSTLHVKPPTMHEQDTQNVDNLKAKIEQLEETVQRIKEELERSKEQTIFSKCGDDATCTNNNNNDDANGHSSGTWF